MQNLGTAAAAMTAAILLGNMLSVPILRPIALKVLGLALAIGLIAAAFFYFSQRYSPTTGWLAAIATLALSLVVLGVAA